MGLQGRTGNLPFEDRDLLTKRQDFQSEIRAGTYQRAQGSQECEDEIDHETTVVTPDVCDAFTGCKPLISRGDRILATRSLVPRDGSRLLYVEHHAETGMRWAKEECLSRLSCSERLPETRTNRFHRSLSCRAAA